MNSNINLPKDEISVAAYYVWQQNKDYSTLCWELAERQMFLEQGFAIPSQTIISKRAEKIFDIRPPYDVLCWLIGELNLFIDKMNTQKTQITQLPK
ncbi:MAG: hypothetical protein BAJALOKI1v1_630006 [Promethearchaeota archaeon]|nr:MAG: hypothetical protein BAJALOKI1v1_630006 [Candidatus Lokiarchaeota archaeon]